MNDQTSDARPLSKRKGIILKAALSVAILCGAFAIGRLLRPASREELEETAADAVMDMLSDNHDLSLYFVLMSVENCLLVKEAPRTYSGVADVCCRWKGDEARDMMANLYESQHYAFDNEKYMAFRQKLENDPRFKFRVTMVADGSRYSVSCRGAKRQANPVWEEVLSLLKMRGYE